MQSPKVLLLEFNELTPALIDRFIADGELPNFARFRREALTMTTLASEPSALLEPWIQWVTVHSGLPHAEHQVSRLDEGHKLLAPRIWDVLSDHGMSSWICGSMNVRCESEARTHLVPDPWCTKVSPSPAELRPYFRFVQTHVIDHTKSGEAPMSRADYLRFATWMLQHGLSAGTVWSIVRQLAAEQVTQCAWKRVSLLDRLQFDLFAHYYRKLDPSFATFFLNSTAHYQHAYWDALEPERYPGADSTDYPARGVRDAIRYGYQKMDDLIGRFFRLVDENTTIILCTALSQEPRPEGVRAHYRIRDFDRFGAFAALGEGYTHAPVMTDQFHLEFPSLEATEEAQQKFLAVRVNDRPIMRLRRDGTRLFVSCHPGTSIPGDTEVTAPTGATAKFSKLFYRVPTRKVADHVPAGILWIRSPQQRGGQVEAHVPLEGVAPTILSLLHVSAPAHMKGPLLIGQPV